MKFKKTIKIKLKDIKPPKCIFWDDSYDELIEETIFSYGENKNYILIDKNNEILDGNYRFCILLESHGEDHEVYVDKILISKWLNYLLVFLFFPILTPIGFLIGSIKKIKYDTRLKKNS